MERGRSEDSEASHSEFSARSTLTWSNDGQRLTIETPQLKAGGVGLILLAVGCLVLSFRARPSVGFTAESAPGSQSGSALLALLGLVSVAMGVHFLATHPSVETVLDAPSQSATVTRTYFGFALQQPAIIPLAAARDTRLAGTDHRYESMAKIVIDIEGGETDLTGASGTDFADDAQKAIRRFLELG